MKHEDVTAIADFAEHLREMARALVAGLVADGFTEEQARIITTGIFAPKINNDNKDNE